MLKRGLSNMTGSAPNTGNIRFFLGYGEQKEIVFLSTPETTPFIWEYQIVINKKYYFLTALDQFNMRDPIAPLVDQIDNTRIIRRYQVGFMTVVDLAGYTSPKTGEQVTNIKRLFPVKSKTKDVLVSIAKELKDSGQSLRGHLFKAMRSKENMAPTVGDTLMPKGPYDLTKLKDTKEFDYDSLFRPDPDKAEMLYQCLMAQAEGRVAEVEEVENDASVSY